MNTPPHFIHRFNHFFFALPGLIIIIILFLLICTGLYSSSIPTLRATILPITLTAYSPSKAQTQGNPFETASTQIVSTVDLEEQLYVAVSRDLLLKFTPGAPLKYGDKIYLEFTVIDTMHSRWTNRIDLFTRNQQIARYIGNQPNRNIIILKE